MAVLVTGATGFIGAHVVLELLSRNIEVKAMVRNPELAKIFPENDLLEIVEINLELLKKIDKDLSIKLNRKEKLLINCDYEQISRVFFNLVKNSIESIQEKCKKTSNISKI